MVRVDRVMRVLIKEPGMMDINNLLICMIVAGLARVYTAGGARYPILSFPGMLQSLSDGRIGRLYIQ